MTDGQSNEAAARVWDSAAVQEQVAEADSLRQQFVDRFPINAWPDLPLESYALGQQIEGGTVCWWLEFHTKSVGSMSGGSSYKHLIFLSSDGTWRYPKEFESVEAAWEAVRSSFVEAFSLASEGRLEETDFVVALSGATALRCKALYMYFPDELLPVSSKAHLDHFLSLLGEDSSGWGAVHANRRLLELLRDVPELAELRTYELGKFLYAWADPRLTTRFVKIAPGERGRHWDECRGGGYICVGWDDVGDLTRYASKDEFREAFRRHFPYDGNEAQVSRKANEVWTLMELEPGDQVIANRGTSEVLAIGTVNDKGYEWRPDRAEYRHTRGVDWDTSKARRIDPVPAWATTTVSKVPAKLYRAIVGEEAGSIPRGSVDPTYLDIEEAVTRQGQVILYGPPGTGKTFTARRAAVWIASGGSASSTAPDLLNDDEAFDATERRADDNLVRVTFHPSYTYEDFVEGFRPKATEGGGLDLVLTDGIFKRLCRAASNDPDRKYVLVIDEINRGNIPKIFGELITLIEKDKRGLSLTLPQSGERFEVPENVIIIGTMNTADRSIHLLDTALRRRFAFIEFLPDPQILAGATVGTLALDVFLSNLNDRIRSRVGREKQLGHAQFFDDGKVVGSVEQFAALFRHDLLPLVQEYLYEDYRELAEVLGTDVIDLEKQRPTALLDDPDQLCVALADEFGAQAAT